MLSAIRSEGVEARSSTSSPEKANNFYCLLNGRRIRREEERRGEAEKEETKRGEDSERGQGVMRVVTRYHS